MWRNLCRVSSLKKLKPSLNNSNSSLPSSTAVKLVQDSVFAENLALTHVNSWFHELGLRRFDRLLSQNDNLGAFGFLNSSNVFGFQRDFRGFATAAEAIESTEEESSDEVHELLEEMKKEFNVRDESKKPKLVNGISHGKMFALRRRQVKIETEAWQNAAKEYQELLEDMCAQKLAPNLPFIKSLFLGWFEPLRNAIAAEQDLCKEGKNRGAYSSHFDLLPADKMAVITMHKLMGLLMTGGGQGTARVIAAACQIGEAIEHEARIHRFLEKSKRKSAEKKSPEVPKDGPDPEKDQDKLRRKVNILMKQQKLHRVRAIVKQQDEAKPWGQDTQVKVGCRLIQLLIETAYIQPAADQIEDGPPDIRPAFMHTLKNVETPRGSRRYGVIECDPLVHKGLEKSPRHMVIPYMPMLLPPVNWTGYDKGAYLFLPSSIMRVHGSKIQRDAVKRTSKDQLQPVFRALNTLGNTKWRVNKRVLGVIDRIWANGGRIADLVDLDDIPLPEEPDTDDETEIKKWKWKVKTINKANRERHSQRCDVELKLAVARKMKDEDGFFYPHNLDFRGRAYPMHPHLNHLGSDLCRGILEFAEGRPLGGSGLRWLKIHLANVYAGGVDKLSYEGREAFTEKHIEDIFDSADRPLEGKRWWLRAEDPFQCLATCMNLAEALRSPSPETTISYTPIHQDGSCNGLQHYAALGRDKLGAAAVNLIGGEKPADVYSGIADRVLVIMQRDAEKDPAADPNVLRARLLLNQVDRKLVKQTVMTSVYGVTYIGARDQIKRRLKERGAIENDVELFAAACYAAKVTLTALGEMFEAARSIMSWLGDCAKIIATENQPVRWTTPLGLPVVQPYRKLGRHIVKTSLQVLTLQRETDKVMVKRQRTAFPPNFVHSLDGSHMMMTAIACNEAGLNFAGVHDSYWTHACDVDQMNRILREKFVELYEAPILENLLQHFQESFPKLTFPPLPERGDLDLKEVLESPYFFN